ncbi:hypothetical protein CBM2629_B40279 [Cupriavidus taiwanensis]|nr:hypothetical protein CBM2629_B40279 [Cupriavidus taiwanensis]
MEGAGLRGAFAQPGGTKRPLGVTAAEQGPRQRTLFQHATHRGKSVYVFLYLPFVY